MVADTRPIVVCCVLNFLINIFVGESNSLRFRTDGGTLQGVEKLAVTKPDSAFLEGKYKSLPALTLLHSLDLRFNLSQFHEHVALLAAGT